MFLDDDKRMLGYYSAESGMELHVTDTDPFSLSKGGGLEDVSLVKKFRMTEEDYDKVGRFNYYFEVHPFTE
jgi:tubulin-specific chaperone B